MQDVIKPFLYLNLSLVEKYNFCLTYHQCLLLDQQPKGSTSRTK